MFKRSVVMGVLVVCLLQASGGPAAADGGCANDALRAELRSGQLPDCRAYELVTPSYKGGVLVAEESLRSEDGSRLIGSSLGAFAGTENEKLICALGGISGLGAFYEFTRTASGWATTALDPPASQFPSACLSAANSDLTQSLWRLRTPSESHSNEGTGGAEGSDQSEAFYVRRADGAFVDVGPVVPPSTPSSSERTVDLAGASDDLSHVLFKHGFQWPGDTTQEGESLYQYNGTGNSSPELVGVEGGKSSTALISQCGTELGSSGGEDTYNAISATGATVFFTARHSGGCPGAQPPVDELFARSGQAQTVAISEPTSLDCSACSTATLEGAHFAGASSDGSKVFFTTTQALLGTDTSENLYEYDFAAAAGQKIVRVSSGAASAQVLGVTRVSEDGSHVYFVASGVLTTEPNGLGQSAEAGGENLYVYERDARFPAGHTAFAAKLSEVDASDWSGVDIRPVRSTPDGRFLLFSSAAHLTADDTSSAGLSQLFRYDSQTGAIVRVSIGQGGFNNNGNIENEADAPAIPFSFYVESSLPTTAESTLAMSNDGSYVFFQSKDSLTPQATSGDRDASGSGSPNVYEYHEGEVSLISDGQDTALVNGSGVTLLGSDASGGDVFFTQVDALVPQDTDTQQDFYDARIAGGFSPPVSPSGCSLAGCQGPLSGSPALASPGSVSQAGAANLAPAAPPAPPTPVKPLSNAQKLANALKACRVKHLKRVRARCVRQARQRYGAHRKSKPASRSRKEGK